MTDTPTPTAGVAIVNRWMVEEAGHDVEKLLKLASMLTRKQRKAYQLSRRNGRTPEEALLEALGAS